MKTLLIFSLASIMISLSDTALAQNKIIRVARLKIDSAHLADYSKFLKEEIEASIKNEPGVLMLYAVRDKVHPTDITIFEIYADTNAYQAHIQSPHFKKYKSGTLQMVKSLELMDAAPIALATKDKK